MLFQRACVCVKSYLPTEAEKLIQDKRAQPSEKFSASLSLLLNRIWTSDSLNWFALLARESCSNQMAPQKPIFCLPSRQKKNNKSLNNGMTFTEAPPAVTPTVVPIAQSNHSISRERPPRPRRTRRRRRRRRRWRKRQKAHFPSPPLKPIPITKVGVVDLTSEARCCMCCPTTYVVSE